MSPLQMMLFLCLTQITSGLFPKCFQLDIWSRINYDGVEGANHIGFLQSEVIGKCAVVCRGKQQTFHGVKRNGRRGARAHCHCGDNFDGLVPADNCGHKCGGQDCGFTSPDHMSVYTVCSVSHYGEQCSSDCPENCVEGVCQVGSGDCHIGCKTGWYGPKCTQSCGNCKNGCIQSDGICELGGCKSGFHGEKCDQTCPVNCGRNDCIQSDGECYSCDQSYYGKYCDNSCSNCKNGCQQDNGICNSGGCMEGYHGTSCQNVCTNCIGGCTQESGVCLSDCVDGYYGTKCDLRCPKNCVELSCIKVNGQCKGQCKDGWYSLFCDKTCPVNCKTRICGSSDGSCTDGCTLGWEGHMCETDVDECSYDNNVCASENRDCYNTEGSYRCCEPYQGFDQGAMSCTGSKRSTLRSWVLPVTSVLCAVFGIAIGIGASIIFQKWRRSRDHDANKTNDARHKTGEFELQPDVSAETYSNDIGNEGQYEECTPYMDIDNNRSYEGINAK